MNKEEIVSTLIDYHANLKCTWTSPYSFFEVMYNTLMEFNIFNPSNLFESLQNLPLEQLERLYKLYIITDPVIPEKEDCKLFEFTNK